VCVCVCVCVCEKLTPWCAPWGSKVTWRKARGSVNFQSTLDTIQVVCSESACKHRIDGTHSRKTGSSGPPPQDAAHPFIHPFIPDRRRGDGEKPLGPVLVGINHGADLACHVGRSSREHCWSALPVEIPAQIEPASSHHDRHLAPLQDVLQSPPAVVRRRRRRRRRIMKIWRRARLGNAQAWPGGRAPRRGGH